MSTNNHKGRVYVDVPVLNSKTPRLSAAELSPTSASKTSTSTTRRTIPLKKKSAEESNKNGKKGKDALSDKRDASVAFPLCPSTVTNLTASTKKRSREDDKDDKQSNSKKRRNVEQTMKQPTKKKSTTSLSSGSLTPISEPEAPALEISIKKTVVKKPPPEPLWTRVGVDFTREEIENRILLREFTIRFNDVFELKKPMLDKLEDFGEFDDTVAKALLLAFVETLKEHSSDADRRKWNDFLKQLRERGMSFHSILTNFNQLRSKLDLSIPNLTSFLKGKKEKDVDAEDMIPTLLGLIDDLMTTKAIRAEVDKWKEDGPDVRKEFFAAMKEERERWSKIRNALNDEKKQGGVGFDLAKWKAKMEKAKAKHDSIEHSTRFEHLRKTSAISARFTPYTDKEGRVYYIHTPSLRKPISKSTRAEFTRWVWFVACWGKKPVDATRVDFEGAEEGEEDEEGWWAFGDVAEVKKLANWISWKDGEGAKEDASNEGGEEEEEGGVNQTKALVNSLNGFVSVLQYADDENPK